LFAEAIMGIAAGGMLCGAACAESRNVTGNVGGSAGLSSQSHLDFVVRIPEVLHLNLLAQPGHLDVTEQDIARGYVESQSTVQILSNSRQGFDVRIEVLDALIAGGDVLGLGPALQLGRGAAAARATHHGKTEKRVIYQLTYRLRLAPGGLPGRYRWPLRIAVNG
jgi:hypothetical protein